MTKLDIFLSHEAATEVVELNSFLDSDELRLFYFELYGIRLIL